eukprot:s1427_g1.t6
MFDSETVAFVSGECDASSMKVAFFHRSKRTATRSSASAMEGRTLATFRPQGSKAVVSFDLVKAFYILGLVGYHQHLLNAPNHRVQVAHYLAYQNVDHGVELMMGMMLISGWLSSATWKDASWANHMQKKVARLIPPYIVAVGFTALPLALECGSWDCLLQYGLEILTIGGWNPMLSSWTMNRPLWFLSTLLAYHYVSPFFLRWTRRHSVRRLAITLVALYALRTGIACLVLMLLDRWTGDLEAYARIIHLWSPMQIWVPFMGAILEQITMRTMLPAWVRKWHIWFLTDVLMLVLIGCTNFLPSTGLPFVDALLAYNNLVSGPFQLVLVVLVSCDCNSFRLLFSLTDGTRKLAAATLKLSYTIYLTHWPWAVCMHYAGLFGQDSWNSMLATWATSILFAILLDFIIIDPFTAKFCGWIMPKPLGKKEAGKEDAQCTGIAQTRNAEQSRDAETGIPLSSLGQAVPHADLLVKLGCFGVLQQHAMDVTACGNVALASAGAWLLCYRFAMLTPCRPVAEVLTTLVGGASLALLAPCLPWPPPPGSAISLAVAGMLLSACTPFFSALLLSISLGVGSAGYAWRLGMCHAAEVPYAHGAFLSLLSLLFVIVFVCTPGIAGPGTIKVLLAPCLGALLVTCGLAGLVAPESKFGLTAPELLSEEGCAPLSSLALRGLGAWLVTSVAGIALQLLFLRLEGRRNESESENKGRLVDRLLPDAEQGEENTGANVPRPGQGGTERYTLLREAIDAPEDADLSYLSAGISVQR